MGATDSFFDDDLDQNFEPTDIITNEQIEIYPQLSNLSISDLIDLIAKAIALLRFSDKFKQKQPGHNTQFKILCYQPIRAKVISDYQILLLAFVKMYTNGALIGIDSIIISEDHYIQEILVTFIENFNSVFFLGARIASEIGCLKGINAQQLSGILMGLLSQKEDQFIALHFDSRILTWDICTEVFGNLPQISQSLNKIYDKHTNCVIQRYVEQYNYFVLFQYQNIEFKHIGELAGTLLQNLITDIQEKSTKSANTYTIPTQINLFPSSLPFIESFINSFLIINQSQYLIVIKQKDIFGVKVISLQIQQVDAYAEEGTRIKKMVATLTSFFKDQYQLNLNAQNIHLEEIIPPIFEYEGEESDVQSENSKLDDSIDETENLIQQKETQKKRQQRKHIKYDKDMASIDLPLSLQTVNSHAKDDVRNKVVDADLKSGLSIDLKTWQKNTQPKINLQKTNMIPPLDRFINQIILEYKNVPSASISYLNSFKYPKIQQYLNLEKFPQQLTQQKVDSYLKGICKEIVRLTGRSTYHNKNDSQIIIE